MIKKIFIILFTCLFTFTCSVNVFAETVTREYSPENYTNISGSYSADNTLAPIKQNDSLSWETDTYKTNIESGKTLLVTVRAQLPSATDNISFHLNVVDSQGNHCAAAISFEGKDDGFAVCAYTAKNSGSYFVNITGSSDQTDDVGYSINISTVELSSVTVSEQFPYSAENSGTEIPAEEKCSVYAFKLNAGDAFSLKVEENDAYILFDTQQAALHGTATRPYEGFNGYAGSTAGNCVAYVFVFGEQSAIEADVLAHSPFVTEELSLPFDGLLDLNDAETPFPVDELTEFTKDFGEDIIDNTPVKFFVFNLQRNQVLRIISDSATFADIIPINVLNGMNVNAGSVGLEEISSFYPQDNNCKQAYTCHISHLTGTFALAVLSTEVTEMPIIAEVFESFATTYEFKESYEAGSTISGIDIKNLFVDTTKLDGAEFELIIPSVSCYKLVGANSGTTFFSPQNDILLENADSYELYAVISNGDIEYQILLHTFKVNERMVTPDIPQETPPITEDGGGLPWWAITLIVIAAFCASCGIFLLVYKKDINEVE